MCDAHGADHETAPLGGAIRSLPHSRHTKFFDVSPLMSTARTLLNEAELRRSAVGFIGYGSTRPGDRVLLATDTEYEPVVVEAVAQALREAGATVDQIVFDAGPDREFTETDEIDAIIRRVPLRQDPRRWDNEHPVIIAVQESAPYDLVIHGKGGPIPDTTHRFEAIPWLDSKVFEQTAASFPRELHTLVNELVWETIWEHGRGAAVELTDPEGTSLSWHLHDGYFDGSRVGFQDRPLYGHLMAHPAEPLLVEEDATGVIAGTTNHFSKPFPRISLTVENGRLEQIDGGGTYGDAWRDLKDETDDVQYPGFPRPGLFWVCEAAFGTHPKIVRPDNLKMLSSGGFEVERRKSGYMHVGLGTFWRTRSEEWAGAEGVPYGHLHVHQMLPTLTLDPVSGNSCTIIENGRLTALDHPRVRDVAAKYGDPDLILSEDWVPRIPGLNMEGSYEDYARSPATHLYGDNNG